MKHGKTLGLRIFGACMLTLLAGCTSQEVSTSAVTQLYTQSSAQAGTQTDQQGEYDFILPDYKPRALVDFAGYETGAEKIVLFCTDEAGDMFELRSAVDDTVVYTGKVKEFRSAGKGMSYGQFTSFQMPGEYYVYTEGTGSSYSFAIEESLNSEKLQDALERFMALRCGSYITDTGALSCHMQSARLRQDPDTEKEVYGGWHTDVYGGRDTLTGCQALRGLLLCLEINPTKLEGTPVQGQEAGSDSSGEKETKSTAEQIADEVMYETAWLFRMQEDNGGVYGGVLTGGNEMSVNLTLTEITQEATVSFAGVMARTAFVFQDVDPALSERALSAAQKAWNYYASHAALAADAAGFAAASELYRMTGEKKYENVLSAFFTKPSFEKLIREEDDVFYGSFSYMRTTQPVNVEVCRTIMTVLLEEAEEIAERAAASTYFVSSEDEETLLRDVIRLAVANHIIYNHEYTKILENHVHYLYGRNEKAIDFVTGDKEVTAKGFDENSIYASPVRLAGFVLLLAAT